jgi:biotin-[acetyl-CoA-carboxylase] ligase BirA-like protein
MTKTQVSLEGVGEWEVFSPPTVYPPREDSLLLCRVISEFVPNPGVKALEIGCGSGIVTMVLATLGWEVSACDLNPFAVSATRGNMEINGISGSHRIIESGVGENLAVPQGTRLVIWNLPYLEREDKDDEFQKIEEIAWSEIPGKGWGGELLNFLDSQLNVNELLVLMVMKTEPEGKSKLVDWERRGWTSRTLGSERFGEEKIEIVAFWKTGSGYTPTIIDTCSSTMEEVMEISGGDWVRVMSKIQTNGRGRKNSQWISEEGGVFATWKLGSNLIEEFSPGLIQTSVGAIVSTVLKAEMKWPNDILNQKGEKMGGVLVESSNDPGSGIRIGIGINRFGFSREEEILVCGWEETLGDVDAEEVFNEIDRGMSSIFERTDFLPVPSKESLVIKSWISLSKSLSRGVSIRLGNEVVRASGLNELGELRVTGGSIGSVDIGDLDIIEWVGYR